MISVFVFAGYRLLCIPDFGDGCVPDAVAYLSLDVVKLERRDRNRGKKTID